MNEKRVAQEIHSNEWQTHGAHIYIYTHIYTYRRIHDIYIQLCVKIAVSVAVITEGRCNYWERASL